MNVRDVIPASTTGCLRHMAREYRPPKC
jgi:hypothetical protein